MFSVAAGWENSAKAAGKSERMKAVIMAGGEGTRLRPLTSNQPKPMVPVMNKPVMEYIIELLKSHGINEVIATLQFLPALVRNYFGDGSDLGVTIAYSVEDTPLGTAGSVKKVESYLDETFIVISGDALTDIDLTEAVSFHKSNKALATLILKNVENHGNSASLLPMKRDASKDSSRNRIGVKSYRTL